MYPRINDYVSQLQKFDSRSSRDLPLPVDNSYFQQRLLEQLKEEEDFYNNYNSGDSGELPIKNQSPVIQNYSLWQFEGTTGTSLDGINLIFESSAGIELVWGDGTVEQISSNVDYNHIFS